MLLTGTAPAGGATVVVRLAVDEPVLQQCGKDPMRGWTSQVALSRYRRSCEAAFGVGDGAQEDGHFADDVLRSVH